MIIATKDDRRTVTDILCAAFEDNKSVSYIVGHGPGRERRIVALMGYSFDMCQLFGEVWLSDDQKACLLYLYPDRKKSSLRSLWLDIKLIWQAVGVGGIGKAITREKLISARQLKGKTLYLWFIGVKPADQQKGAGSRLLKELIDVADIESRTILLETSTARNLPWYRSLGFQTYTELDFRYRLHFLKKEPD
jgi:ribosomal protein S18 acetylase RimI-like enzyme